MGLTSEITDEVSLVVLISGLWNQHNNHLIFIPVFVYAGYAPQRKTTRKFNSTPSTPTPSNHMSSVWEGVITLCGKWPGDLDLFLELL